MPIHQQRPERVSKSPKLNNFFLRSCFFSWLRKLVCEMQWISLYKRITLPLQIKRKGIHVKFPRNSTTEYSNFSQSSENWRTVRKASAWPASLDRRSLAAFTPCFWLLSWPASSGARKESIGTPHAWHTIVKLNEPDRPGRVFRLRKTSFETPLKELACQRTDRHWYTGSASIHYAPTTRSSWTTAIGRMLVHWWRCVKSPVHACVAL